MKYILETSEPLSEVLIQFIKSIEGNTKVDSIKPLIVDEKGLEELAETYANKMTTDYGYYNDWSPLNEGFKDGYRKALGYD